MEYYYNNNRGGFLSNLPTVTKNLLIINVIMFFFTSLRENAMYAAFALYYPTSPNFHVWQLVTHMFMHGGFWHLFANMFTMVMFGTVLERQWGPKKYLLFYFVTGLGAAALHLGVQALQMHHYLGIIADGGAGYAAARHAVEMIKFIPTVGASGAIYGVLMGYAMLFPDTRITMIFPPISLKAKWWILIWFLIELVTGVSGAGGGIAHFAHLGGMIFGYVLIRYWKNNGRMYDYER